MYIYTLNQNLQLLGASHTANDIVEQNATLIYYYVKSQWQISLPFANDTELRLTSKVKQRTEDFKLEFL